MANFIRYTAFILFAFLLYSGNVTAEIKGRFVKINTIPKANQADVVQFDEYFNFTCPHCNNFREAAKPLLKKYGKKLKVNNIPITFRGQSDFPLRLFYIAQKAGRGPEIKAAIFDAAFKFGVNIYDPAVVNYLAKSAGLGELYKKEMNAAWVMAKVNEGMSKADMAGVKATPTVVLQGAMLTSPEVGMNEYVTNLDKLIGQLLK